MLFLLTVGYGSEIAGKIPDEINGKSHKIPHIGWNKLEDFDKNKKNNLLSNDGFSVYFVHSYMAKCKNNNNLDATCNYNGLIIPAIVSYKNSYGCQFHPEKSGNDGLSILKNFLSLDHE